ncbi:hypothetical protein BD309DRAFT_258974 [Dichomitus squalens]|uniref:uncharacterized protein n=1 Tax=Dichomitus squalens (strain LYAD-421) TaxID=732165 RepID=UPI0004411595|nr:uncharacterized protein DICSQDRAFT_154022 [Dichomitus squalens LYAD-421 SS1]EJF63533.1 hypothetical protein DICSQDRAFT_154022 [Dichomitus squalens LYAD-421 SS1]TBU41606.1 hypothetical protein BD309DRAFT_258974 [Dichomitus squalens]
MTLGLRLWRFVSLEDRVIFLIFSQGRREHSALASLPCAQNRVNSDLVVSRWVISQKNVRCTRSSGCQCTSSQRLVTSSSWSGDVLDYAPTDALDGSRVLVFLLETARGAAAIAQKPREEPRKRRMT